MATSIERAAGRRIPFRQRSLRVKCLWLLLIVEINWEDRTMTESRDKKDAGEAGDDRHEVLNGRRPRGDAKLINDIVSAGQTSATTGSFDAGVEIPPSRPGKEEEPAAKAFAGTPPSR